MHVTLAFKKKQDTLDDILAWWTNCDYTHVEVIIKDKWISSGATHGGVYINELRELTDKWKYINVDVDGRVLNTVMKFVHDQEGKDYDWAGIVLSQFFNMAREEDQSKWFCSEIVAEILKRFRAPEINLSSIEYSPADLWYIYKDNTSDTKDKD